MRTPPLLHPEGPRPPPSTACPGMRAASLTQRETHNCIGLNLPVQQILPGLDA